MRRRWRTYHLALVPGVSGFEGEQFSGGQMLSARSSLPFVLQGLCNTEEVDVYCQQR